MSRRQYFTNKGAGTNVPLGVGLTSLVDLDNRQQNKRLQVTITGELNVSVNTTGTVNRGLPSAALQFSIRENGGQMYGFPAEGRMLRAFAESRAASPLPATVVPAAPAIGVYAFRETFSIIFADPMAARPRETAYIEGNPNSRLQLAVTLKANAVRCLVTGGAATLQNVVVNVKQDADPAEAGLPLFKPRWDEIAQVVAASNAADILRVDTPYRLRGLVISAEADKADGGTVEVNDVIDAIQLLGDGGNYLIGPNDVPFADLLDDNAEKYGGEVGGASRAYVVLDFQRNGRLADVPFPAMEFSNFRLQLNDQPTVTAGLANTRLRVAKLEYTRPDAVGGWNVVQPFADGEVPEFLQL